MTDFEKMLRKHFPIEKVEYLLSLKDKQAIYGLRMNRVKQVDLDFAGKPSVLNDKMWIPDDYASTVTHPYHHAGVYYIQDPSASLAVEFMELEKDDYVLDLCAAPGGKSTEILNQIPNGFLLANEINPKRNRRLQANLQRWGQDHVAVSLASSQVLAKHFPNHFDKIIVDAPCSAEGLFRRKKDLIENYDLDDPHQFTPIQETLLEDAYKMLRPGGVLLYATCTLNPYENEGVVESFLAKHPDCHLLPIEHPMKESGLYGQEEVARFYPSEHGEGHFMAKIYCAKDGQRANTLQFKNMRKDSKTEYYLQEEDKKTSVLFNRPALKEMNFIQMDMLPFKRIHRGQKVQYLPEVSRYPEIQSLLPSYDLTLEEAYAYLHGLTIAVDHPNAWVIMRYEGMPLGLAKIVQSRAKNYYPKAERNRFSSYP